MRDANEVYENFIAYLTTRRRSLKKDIMMARVDKEPTEVVHEAVQLSILLTLSVAFIIFLLLNEAGISPLWTIATIPFLLLGFYQYRLLGIKSKVVSRRKEINKDVLFAGRYLLVKLNSGAPLVNALSEAANSYGMANKYFREIMNDIDLGKPVEDALQRAAEYSPSEKFRKIIFQINNALKIGIDVTEFLRETLEEIVEDQILQIKRYGKKLNSVTLFYLLLGIVLPSLGMTILTIVASISNFSGWPFYSSVLLFLIILQSIFLITYRQIRPNLNI
jgi:pilus assembly protein TadC